MKIRINATGIRPLLMHNVRLASPLNSYAKRLKTLNSKRVKTDDDRYEIAHVEWEGGLYFEDDIGPYIPGPSIYRCLIDGARLTKAGKKIERGVNVCELVHPLIYRGPRDLDGLWGNGESEYVDIRTARVGTSKIDRCRPIFRNWGFEADCLIDPKVIDFEEFSEVVRNAGEMSGVGDYRLMYGRFTAEVTRI